MEFYSDDRVIVNPLRLKPAVVQEFEASLVVYHTGVARSSSGIIEKQVAHVEAGDPAQIEATHLLKQETWAMKEALLTGGLDRVAGVLQRGWEAKKQLADGITTPEIEYLFSVAEAAGALAGKVSGAGGGGYVLFLVDPIERPRLIGALKSLGQGSVEATHFVSEGAVAWTIR